LGFELVTQKRLPLAAFFALSFIKKRVVDTPYFLDECCGGGGGGVGVGVGRVCDGGGNVPCPVYI
jgi:hypothetical protein